jgi:hypothetical protein
VRPFMATFARLYNHHMSTPYSDTHPKMEQMQIEFIRRMPSWKKMSMVEGLNETVKTLAVTGIKQRHPDATPEQVRRMLADLMLGPELARKVYDDAR